MTGFEGIDNVALSTLNVLSLCTGIGGIELGLELAGQELGLRFRTVCMVEREVYAAVPQCAARAFIELWREITEFP